ncbi:MAG: hypothetical protein KAV87_62735 [Desulfobacteraceae bacterium]|nr:hypothetical protein [Desulfobacteraceae bacterium]
MIPQGRKTALRWGPKITASVLDQAIFSSSNFILSILLARWLIPESYGAYAIVYSIFLFVSGIYNALLLEPMTVYGPSRHMDFLSGYFKSSFNLHVLITLGLSGLVFIASVILAIRGNFLAQTLMGLAIAIPFMLLYWMIRRKCYIIGRPNLSVIGSMIYAVLILGGVFALWKTNLISPFLAFLLLAGASALVSVIVSRLLHSYIHSNIHGGEIRTPGSVLAENLVYGRWLLASVIVFWLVNLVYIPLVGILIGLNLAGVMKAIQNLYLPVEQSLTAMGLLLLPWLSGNRKNRGDQIVLKIAGVVSLIASILALIYLLLMNLFGTFLLDALYNQPLYLAFAQLIPFIGVVAVLRAALFGFTLGVRAIEHSKATFYSYAAGAVASLSIGIFLVKTWGLPGAVGGQVLSILVSLIVLILFWWSYLRGSNHTSPISNKSRSSD